MLRQFTEEGILKYPKLPETVKAITPMYYMRAFGGLLYLTGTCTGVYVLIRMQYRVHSRRKKLLKLRPLKKLTLLTPANTGIGGLNAALFNSWFWPCNGSYRWVG